MRSRTRRRMIKNNIDTIKNMKRSAIPFASSPPKKKAGVTWRPRTLYHSAAEAKRPLPLTHAVDRPPAPLPFIDTHSTAPKGLLKYPSAPFTHLSRDSRQPRKRMTAQFG
ncbi:hypothetical protein, unlikely [Trypanosoma brucei gambiense DAL972]|uniref:Uncharacterized protein n=1 Tax=Trypanosoma brucei gambiense (strain MHOM/CI/86/DAL972) TaxID=679716 RepID=D0A902_TRYB9|nr:hypothetical protein, unlikely [Trypanosoma brucei gambiense DAL972]CBH18153.1 hypothetical protein, unlikely [Trypanosoma brucei gambiense DAL972]|eukprot:XP_011780417.1 hypothetical protein, unlikely [Trypanosoma brucei gambiense DAL972]